MKKLCILLGVFLMTNIAGAQTYQLTKMSGTSGLEDYFYFYDNQNRIDSIKEYSLSDYEYHIGTKFVYDEKGNVIRQKGYQIMPGDTEYTHSMLIEYEYDEQNHIITRKNYNINLETNEFMLGGVYKYTYDGSNLVKRELFWDDTMSEVAEEMIYEYYDNGLMKKQTQYSVSTFFGKEFSSSSEYFYDKNGKITDIKYYFPNIKTLEPELSGGALYKYDDNGNIEEYINYSSSPQSPVRRDVYTYLTDVKATDIAIARSPEIDNTIQDNSVNAIATNVIYRADFNTGELGLYDVMEYEYTFVNRSSVQSVKSEYNLLTLWQADSNTLYLKNLGNNDIIRIYDLSGKLVNLSVYNNDTGINIGNFNPGVYCISTDNGVAKFIKQ